MLYSHTFNKILFNDTFLCQPLYNIIYDLFFYLVKTIIFLKYKSYSTIRLCSLFWSSTLFSLPNSFYQIRLTSDQPVKGCEARPGTRNESIFVHREFLDGSYSNAVQWCWFRFDKNRMPNAVENYVNPLKYDMLQVNICVK